MTTAEDICNLALGSIGLSPISSLSQSTQNARTCNLFYAIVRDSYLIEHDWSFCAKIIELTEETTEVEGYDWARYKFSYPVDCLKARRITDGESNYSYPFIIRDVEISLVETKLIFTGIEEAFLEYTLAMTDPDSFDQTFLMALSKKIAFEISWPLTKDAKIQKQAFDQYLIADNAAKQKDGSERLIEPYPLTWEEARTGIWRQPIWRPWPI